MQPLVGRPPLNREGGRIVVRTIDTPSAR